MARYLKREQGTAIIWGEDGATGVTKVLTFEALASTEAQMGVYADLGEQWDDEYLIDFAVESGATPPTAGGTISLYMVCSYDATNWPGGVTGADGAWQNAEEAEWAPQLGTPAVILVATNDANTVERQDCVIWRPTARYVAPVVYNNWDQDVRDETTATDNDSRIILVPRRLKSQGTT